MKILHYSQGTKDLMLTYRKTDYLVIVGYSDSDYAGCTDTCIMYLLARRSNIIKECEAYIIIVASTMKAEFVACFEATIKELWLRSLISGLEYVNIIV